MVSQKSTRSLGQQKSVLKEGSQGPTTPRAPTRSASRVSFQDMSGDDDRTERSVDRGASRRFEHSKSGTSNRAASQPTNLDRSYSHASRPAHGDFYRGLSQYSRHDDFGESPGSPEPQSELSPGFRSQTPPPSNNRSDSPDNRPNLRYTRSRAAREFDGYREGAIGLPEYVLDFKEWADRRWELIRNAFKEDDKHMMVVGGAVSRKGMSKSEWVDLCRKLGYNGKADLIFEEICKELFNETEDKRLDQYRNQAEDRSTRYSIKQQNTISLSQLRRFEGRLKKVDANLEAKSSGSPADQFVQCLIKKRGTVLRAWRMDIDVRKTGRVSYIDFAQRCRDLGASSQPRKIWASLCPDGQPLEFQALAPEEAANLEAFANTLWTAVGFDLDKAWEFMDSSHQNWLSAQEFEESARELGFEGDTQLIFCGLDSTGLAQPPLNKRGLGRVWRSEFNYLQKITQISRSVLNNSSGAVADLVTWAKREQGGPEEFMSKLGLGGKSQEIPVGDLAARLAALGFEGDAREAANRAARSEDGNHSGTMVSVESLMGLLTGARSTATKGSRVGARSASATRRYRPKTQPKQGWSSGVYNLSESNTLKPKGARSYFSEQQGAMQDYAPPRSDDPFDYSKGNITDRPNWNPSHGMLSASALNCQLPIHTRHYFSNFSDKPVQQEIWMKLGDGRNRRL